MKIRFIALVIPAIFLGLLYPTIAESSISLSCPCTVEQVNQTMAKVSFGVLFDSEAIRTMKFTASLGVGEARGGLFKFWSKSDQVIAEYQPEAQFFELEMPLYGFAEKTSGFLLLRLYDEEEEYLAENLLGVSKVDIQAPYGVRFSSTEKMMFLSKPEFSISDEEVSIQIDKIKSLSKRNEIADYQFAIRVLGDNVFFSKGELEQAVSFAGDGSASLNVSIPLTRKIDSHIQDNPSQSNVVLYVLSEGETVLRYFLDSIDDSFQLAPNLDLSSVQILEDLDNDGFSDYLAALLRQGYGASELGSAAVIRLGFSYGQQASSYYGGSLSARIDHVLATTNEFFSRSGVNLVFQKGNLSYVGDDSNVLPTGEYLSQLREREGVFRKLEGQEESDLIFHLIAKSEGAVAGIAKLGGTKSNGILHREKIVSRGINVAIINLAETDTMFAHELGHLLGLTHPRLVPDELFGQSTFPWASGYGQLNSFTTLMGNPSDFNVAERIGYFSSPLLECNLEGDRCGVFRNDLVDGADAVTTLNVTGWQVSGYSGGFPPYIGLQSPTEVFSGSLATVRANNLIALDAEDGDVTAKITQHLTQAPASDYVKTFTQTFSVIDSDGNGAEVSRLIHLLSDLDGDGTADLEDAFPLNAQESVDSDSDGVGDNSDRFPNDASESVDTDGDQVGDNSDNCSTVFNSDQLNSDNDPLGNACDLDDDNDGFTDEEELADGTDPLSRFSCRAGCFSFDVDENLEAQPLTDGLLVIRHLFGFSGDSLTSGAVSGEASRDSSAAITGYLTDAESELDIDGDGESKPLTDGLLLIRYLFGFSGDSLISGAIGSGAERDTAEEVEAYIQ